MYELKTLIGSKVIVDKYGNVGEVLNIWFQMGVLVCAVKYDDPDLHLFGGYKTVPASEIKELP